MKRCINLNNFLNHEHLENSDFFNVKKIKEEVFEIIFKKNEKLTDDGAIEICFKLNSASLSYCIPGQDFCLSNIDGEFSIEFGSRFPLPFFTCLQESTGITIISENGLDKKFKVLKRNTYFELLVTFYDLSNFTPKFLINLHTNTWKDGLLFYKQYYIEKYGIKKNNVFKNCFHFKRYALYKNHLSNNVFNNGKYTLFDEYKKDVKNLGGIDIVQLFDWAYTDKNGRVGSYYPWDYIYDINQLNSNISQIKNKGAIIFAYIDGYFVEKNTQLEKDFNFFHTIKNRKQEPYYQLGDKYWVICPYSIEWCKFVANVVSDVSKRLLIDGIYLDQYGYGNQYTCFDKNHNHGNRSSQIFGEMNLINYIKKDFKKPIILEYFPVDCCVNNCDAYLTDNDNVLIISRFAIPNIKQFKVITCDEPIGENDLAVNKAFFNGVGLWLDGDSGSEIWYSKKVLSLIRKHYLIMKKYADCFESNDVFPLIDVLSDCVFCNLFISKNKILWTLFNSSNTDFFGNLINISKFNYDDYDFYDAYNDKPIKVSYENFGVFLICNVKKHECGCVVAIKKKHVLTD